MARRKTHEEFVEELKLVNPNIEVLEQYITALEPILCRCLKDGYEWKSRPSDLLKGCGCPKCSGNVKKTHEEFVTELNLINPNIDIIGQYQGANEKLHCRCKIDGHEWYVTPNKLLHGRGCPKCKTQKIKEVCVKTNKCFYEQLEKVNPNVDVLEDYINNRTPIKCRCKIDNYIWYPTPNSLLSGVGCPKCNNVERITHDEFINRLNLINPHIEVLSHYTTMTSKVLCKCKKCSNEWNGLPVSLLHGTGCPHCNISKGENAIDSWLKIHNITFTLHKKYDDLLGVGGGNLSYDFYLHDYNLLIEYQGQFHDGTTTGNLQSKEQLGIQQEHDRRKRKYAKENNIELLEIWYWDFNNIEQILSEKLNINSNKELT